MTSRIWTIAAALFCLAAASATRPARHPVPDLPAQARAERLILEVFRRDLSSASRDDHVVLARKLLQQGMETADNPAAVFVLLRESRDLAASISDMPTACRAHDKLIEQFDVDASKLTLALFNMAGDRARTESSNAAVASAALKYVDLFLNRDDYPTAAKLASLAESQAIKSKNISLHERVADQKREVESLTQAAQLAAAARSKLLQSPEDPEANQTVGRFLCLFKGDFSTGLSHLRKGRTEPLNELATADVAALDDHDKRFAVADRWWNLAAGMGPTAQRNLRSRAAEHYRAALPFLSGLNRSIAQKRLDEIEQFRLAQSNLSPGLVAELFKGVDFSQPVRTRIDKQIDFEWADAPADESLGKDNFSIRWTGLLKIDVAGKHEFTVHANTGVRLFIDDKLVLDNPNMTRLRSGARFTADLPSGLHPIKLEYWDSSGLAKMRLLWRFGGTVNPTPVPAAAFYHDSLLAPSAGS